MRSVTLDDRSGHGGPCLASGRLARSQDFTTKTPPRAALVLLVTRCRRRQEVGVYTSCSAGRVGRARRSFVDLLDRHSALMRCSGAEEMRSCRQLLPSPSPQLLILFTGSSIMG